MKKRNLFILTGLLVVLAGLAYYLITKKSTTSTLGKKESDFALEDTASVTRIFLADRDGNKVMLVSKHEKWLVNGKSLANQSRVNTLLETLPRIRIKSPVPLNARQNVIKDLATKGIKTEIYRGKALMKTYYVDGPTKDHLGTYMALETKELKPFIVHIPGWEGYLSTRFFTSVKEWQTKKVFPFNPLEIREVRIRYSGHPSSSFHLKVNGPENFEVRNLQKPVKKNTEPSPEAIKRYLVRFDELQFVRYLEMSGKKKLDSLSRLEPAITVQVKGKKDRFNTLELYPYFSRGDTSHTYQAIPPTEKFFARSSKRKNDVLIMQKMTLEKILKGWKDFQSAK